MNNTQIDDAYDIDVVMPVYNLIEYRGIYSKISESLWQYYTDDPVLDSTNNIIDFPADDNNNHNNNNNSILFKFNEKSQGKQETMAQSMFK